MIKFNVGKVTTIVTIYLGALVILTCLNRVQAQEAQKAGTSSYGTTGNYQSFANGYIYQSKYGTYSVYTTIRMLHERYGGTWGTYGFPITDRYYDQTEKDYCQWFEGGKLCEHTNQVELKIRDKENSLGNAKPEGEIHQWCGTYVRDYQSIGGKKDSIIMYNPNKSEAYLITGGIWESYWKKGGCERYGYPEMDERNTGRIEGWYQDFEKATIYWSKSNEKSQPGIVEEEIKEYYHKKGGTWSYLGFPEGEKWGNKDNTKSTCGTNGIEQNFNGGKIYISKVGKVDWEYGELMDYYWNIGEVNGALGWPKAGSYTKSSNTIYFENGKIINKSDFLGLRSKIEHVLEGGCTNQLQREDDYNSGAPKNVVDAIHKKEDESFNNFKRSEGQLGKIHQYCGGWIVDYDKVEFKNGTKLNQKVWIISNSDGTKVHILEGKIADKYWNRNGCSLLGLPSTDSIKRSEHKNWGTWPFRHEGFTYQQKFEKGDIYYYSEETGEKVYIVDGIIRDKYNTNNGLSGNYKFVKTDEYSKTQNSVTTQCQDFDGGTICDNELPPDSEEQKALEKLLGREVEQSEIYEACGGRKFIDLDNGVAYYDPEYKNVQKIIGEIFKKWNDGKCNKYGLPWEAQSDKEREGKQGQFQRFHKDEITFDFYYTQDYGTKVLEGDSRNIFNSKGFDKLGFPKTEEIYLTTAICTNEAWGRYIDVQLGRVYDNSGNNYFVNAQNKIGKYFFDNGAHEKFGLPESDEYRSGLNKQQIYQLSTVKVDFLGNIESDPSLDQIKCSEEEIKCTENEVLDNGVCVDKKEYECKSKSMIKFTDSEGIISCAKLINVPYINQYLKDDGTYSEPSQGKNMCGAASVTMIAAFYNKIPILQQSSRIKDYMYTDQGRGYGNPCNDSNQAGAFAITHYQCNQSHLDGIKNYLDKVNLSYEEKWHTSLDNEIMWKFVTDSIDKGYPVITAYGWEEDQLFGHITVITGYVNDNGRREFIMNDSFTNTSKYGITNGYSFEGYNATYSLWQDKWIPSYILSIHK